MINKPCDIYNQMPIPKDYPFNGTYSHDTYSYCVCGEHQPPFPPSHHNPHPAPPSPRYPAYGPFMGSAFALHDTMPYLIDTSHTSYGQVLCYSENVYTKVTQRKDPSCINLSATLNFTDTMSANRTRLDFLEKHIARKYSYLMGVLPIIKSSLKFKFYYTITDVGHGVTHQGTIVTTVLDNHFHFTDVPDSYIQSAKGVIIENIPAMTYQGLYTLTIERAEIFVHVINTKDHLDDGLNPFYTFTDNNMKIRLDHRAIESEMPDDDLLIAECVINKSFDYHANITNRLRMTFVAFTSIPIACGNTSPIWESLNEPTGDIINQLRVELSAVQDDLKSLHEIIEQQNQIIQNLSGQIELNRQNIGSNTQRIQALEVMGNAYEERLNDHERRIQVLEAIPLATVSYKAGREFTRAQLTWKTYGDLYQVAVAYTATGDFDRDVANGFLVEVATSAADVTALTERVNEVEDVATSAQTTAEGFAAAITDNTNQISTLNSSVSTITTSLQTAQSDISTLQTDTAANTSEIADINTEIVTITSNISNLSDLVDSATESISVMQSDIADIKEVLPINNDDNP